MKWCLCTDVHVYLAFIPKMPCVSFIVYVPTAVRYTSTGSAMRGVHCNLPTCITFTKLRLNFRYYLFVNLLWSAGKLLSYPIVCGYFNSTYQECISIKLNGWAGAPSGCFTNEAGCHWQIKCTLQNLSFIDF